MARSASKTASAVPNSPRSTASSAPSSGSEPAAVDHAIEVGGRVGHGRGRGGRARGGATEHQGLAGLHAAQPGGVVHQRGEARVIAERLGMHPGGRVPGQRLRQAVGPMQGLREHQRGPGPHAMVVGRCAAEGFGQMAPERWQIVLHIVELGEPGGRERGQRPQPGRRRQGVGPSEPIAAGQTQVAVVRIEPLGERQPDADARIGPRIEIGVQAGAHGGSLVMATEPGQQQGLLALQAGAVDRMPGRGDRRLQLGEPARRRSGTHLGAAVNPAVAGR
jgi:hypothetical protein